MSSALLKKSVQIVEESQKEEKQQKNKDKNRQQEKDLKRLGDKKTEKDKNEMKKFRKGNKNKCGIDKSTAEMLFNYALGESRALPQQKNKKKEESIFTDDDFNKFEKEYFG